jgi:hypothetical protein
MIVPDTQMVPWKSFNPWSFAAWQQAGAAGSFVVQWILAVIGIAMVGAILAWIGYAWSTRYTVVKRLSEAAAINTEAP